MNIYRGTRRNHALIVKVNEKKLPPRVDLNHCCSKFGCGYDGSGPAHLALAILAYELGDEAALELCRQFKSEIVAKLNPAAWELRSEDILDWAKNRRSWESPLPSACASTESKQQ